MSSTTNEITGGMLLVYLTCILVLKKKKPDFKIILYYIICIIFTLTVILAPGNTNRSNNIEKVKLFDISVAFNLIVEYFEYIISEYNAILITALVLTIILIAFEKYTFWEVIKRIFPIFIAAFAGAGALSLTSFFTHRPLIFSELLILTAVWIIVRMTADSKICELSEEHLKKLIELFCPISIAISAFVCLYFLIGVLFSLLYSLFIGILTYIFISKSVRKQNFDEIKINNLNKKFLSAQRFFTVNKKKLLSCIAVLFAALTVYYTVDFTADVHETADICVEGYNTYKETGKTDVILSPNSKFIPEESLRVDKDYLFSWIYACEKYEIIRPETEIYFTTDE